MCTVRNPAGGYRNPDSRQLVLLVVVFFPTPSVRADGNTVGGYRLPGSKPLALIVVVFSQYSAFVPMGILLASTGFVTEEHAGLAVAFLVISQMFFGLSRAGFLISVMDFAPR